MSKCKYCEKEIKSGDKVEITHKDCFNTIADIEAKLTEKDKEIERWHNNYKQRDRQFQSVRQRYHLLNRLQAKYHDKHKLHLSEMQCLELVEENEKLHKDKISFAVEQLEKVRTQFRTKYSWYDETHRVCEKTDNFVIWLDNQIKQLKEMK